MNAAACASDGLATTGVGAGIGAGVGVGVGRDLGVGVGVGVAATAGVGVGVGVGAGAGVGAGVDGDEGRPCASTIRATGRTPASDITQMIARIAAMMADRRVG